MLSDLVKDNATRAAMEANDGDWVDNPFRFFRGVVMDKTFAVACNEVVIPVGLGFRPELLIPLRVSPVSANVSIHYDKFSVGNIVLSVSAACRVVALVGRFDSQVTGQGVK